MENKEFDIRSHGLSLHFKAKIILFFILFVCKMKMMMLGLREEILRTGTGDCISVFVEPPVDETRCKTFKLLVLLCRHYSGVTWEQ